MGKFTEKSLTTFSFLLQLPLFLSGDTFYHVTKQQETPHQMQELDLALPFLKFMSQINFYCV